LRTSHFVETILCRELHNTENIIARWGEIKKVQATSQDSEMGHIDWSETINIS